jgi:hypothetical protein
MAKSDVGKVMVNLQRRDVALFLDLAQQPMAFDHCAELHFGGRSEAARIRIRALAAAGLVRRGKDKAGIRTLVFATRPAGTGRERKSSVVEPRHSAAQTLEHSLQILDVKAAFLRAARSAPDFAVAEFGTEGRFHQFPSTHGRNRVMPDGFFRLKTESRSTPEPSFFVELDRSTETVGTLGAKAR